MSDELRIEVERSRPYMVEAADMLDAFSSPPAGYRKLPSGIRCRCIRLWTNGMNHYCCRGRKGPHSSNADIPATGQPQPPETFPEGLRMAIEKVGAERERAAIVEWIRAEIDRAFAQEALTIAEVSALSRLKRAIERGEHGGGE